MFFRQTVDDSSILFQCDDGSGGLVVYLTMDGANEAVVVNEDSADIDFRVESNGNANMLFVDGGNNRVCINSATGVTTSTTGKLQLSGTDNSGSTFTLGRFSDNANSPSIDFVKSRNATIGGNTIVQDDDNLGGMAFYASDGSDTVSMAGKIMAEIDGTPGSNDMPGRISIFTTADGASSPTEHFRIASNGDLTATDTSIASNSDLRLKKNIENFEGGLDIISKLQPRNFEWKNPKLHKEGTRRGFIAQEVNEVDEYWISTKKLREEEEDYQYVKDTEGQSFVSKLNDKDAMYVSAIQELKEEIDLLKANLEQLKYNRR
jgi:prepilin-type processing-associated H-X9-DG protein